VKNKVKKLILIPYLDNK